MEEEESEICSISSTDTEEYDIEEQSFTDLTPLQPVNDDGNEFQENESQNSSFPSHSGLTEGEIIPKTVVETFDFKDCDNFEVIPMEEGDAVSELKDTEEEIISKLIQEKISYSEVAQLLGDEEESGEEEVDSVEKEVDEEDHAVEFEKEFKIQQKYQLKRRGGERRRSRRRIPDPTLQGLMGEANLRFARREYDEAIKMCMEIVRQYPNTSEPYQTLGLIYEAQNMKNKSLQFMFIAAFLSHDSVLWEKLADLFLREKDDVSQAIFCWSRAIKANPHNLDYHNERCRLYERLGDKKRALNAYIYMVKFLRDDQGIDGLKLAKVIAKIHFENGDIVLAQQALETAFKRYPSFVTAEDVNLMLEVLMQRELYSDCVHVLVEYMHIELICANHSLISFTSLPFHEQVTSATLIQIPPQLPIELRIKLAICCARLKNYDVGKPIVKDLLKLSTDEYGDLYFDIAEGFSKAGNPSCAIEVLEPLLSSSVFGVAAVWLLYGECLYACSRVNDAVEAYEQVVHMAPQLDEPRLTLSGILCELGKIDDALEVLKQTDPENPMNSKLLYRTCVILLEQQRWDELFETVKIYFYRHFPVIRSKEEIEILMSAKRMNIKMETIREIRRAKLEPVEDDDYFFAEPDVGVEDQWQLFKTVCEALQKQGRTVELQRFTFGALGHKEFTKDPERTKLIDLYCIISCICNDNVSFIYNQVKEMVIRNPSSTRLWNLLSYIVSKADDVKHHRFLIRLSHKFSSVLPLSILNGHSSLLSGTYNFSAAEYSYAWKEHSNYPFLALMLGIVYSHMGCQKFSSNKNTLTLTATAYLNSYLDTRGECQEAFYNLGRAMHQLNLLPLATFYYKKALEYPPVVSDDPNDPSMDLSRDIAFNLSLIYRNSGNRDLARMYINKYIRYDK